MHRPAGGRFARRQGNSCTGVTAFAVIFFQGPVTVTTTTSTDTGPQPVPAGLWRRLGAVGYDVLLLLAVLFLATAMILPFTHGEAVNAHNPLYTSYLFITTFVYFAWFWTHGGQTLGMRAWGLRLEQANGEPVTLWHALLRFLAAIPSWLLLAGVLMALFNPQRQTWYDRSVCGC